MCTYVFTYDRINLLLFAHPHIDVLIYIYTNTHLYTKYNYRAVNVSPVETSKCVIP